MARTQLPTTLIADETIVRADLNVGTSGSAVIRKLIQGTGISISSTGADAGTGDVTVSINSSSVVTSFNTRTGAVTLSSGDVTTALGFTPISGYTETDTLATVTGRGATTSTNLTFTGGVLTLNNATSNRINFGLNGVAAPTFSSYSAGVKLVLYNSVQAADAGFTIGVANTNFFFTTGTTGSGYTFYGGLTAAMTISGTGNVVATGSVRASKYLVVDTTNSSVFRIGDSTSTEGGLYLRSGATSDGEIAGGVYFVNGLAYAAATGASAVNFYAGDIYFTGNSGLTVGATYTPTTRMLLKSNGNLLIGSLTDPGYKLYVVGDIGLSGNIVPTGGAQTLGTFSNRFGDVWAGGLIVGTTFYGDNHQSASNFLYFKDGGGTEKMRMTDLGNFLIGGTTDLGYRLTVTGSIYATSDIIAFSDARVKKNVRPIPLALEKVLSMRGVYYEPTLHPGTGDRVGVIAQEVESVIPELVTTDKNGMKGVMYQNIVGVLIEAIKEQNEKIQQLEKLINELA